MRPAASDTTAVPGFIIVAGHPARWQLLSELARADLAVHEPTAAGLAFRSDVITGPGGRQFVLDEPAGNSVELFEPARA